MTAEVYREEFPLPLKHKGIYRENLSALDNNTFVVCALFTPGRSKYRKQAERLAESCEKFGLPFSIYEVPEVHTSINLNGTGDMAFTKANFIFHNLERFPQKDVLYVDVDILFLDFPLTIADISAKAYDFAIYNWLSDEHNESYVPVMTELGGKKIDSQFYVYSHHIAYFSNTELICSGGVQFYGNGPGSRTLLKKWQEVIAQNPRSADDECLDYAYNNPDSTAIKLQTAWLDKPYLRLPWWPHVKPVILHPGMPTAGGNRLSPAEREGKKRFHPEKCLKKTLPLRFSPDRVIDTKRRLLLRIKNSVVTDIQEIAQEFWVYDQDLE